MLNQFKKINLEEKNSKGVEVENRDYTDFYKDFIVVNEAKARFCYSLVEKLSVPSNKRSALTHSCCN